MHYVILNVVFLHELDPYNKLLEQFLWKIGIFEVNFEPTCGRFGMDWNLLNCQTFI